ncbi:MAG: hypothetical protein AMS24_03530 [Chlamydiae bacterium SM23_39]|nr:MAG: hypothetical protein AMS24_03530 [Chlamydiae bacterium SM23_39]
MITPVILTKNSEKTIKNTLNSIKSFEEIIILDTGSSDKTLQIAINFKNTKIFKSEFKGFGLLRNEAANKTKNDWILALDSDEIITENLLKELQNIELNENIVYSIPFFNFYNKKLIKCCGWHNKRHIRLYNKKTTKFDNSLVHEGVIYKNLQIKKLKNPIHHFPFNSISDFIKKIEKYSSLFAEENIYKKSSINKAIIHSLFSFFKSYFIKRGIFSGKEGLIISIYNSNTAFYKYLKIAERWF